MLYVKKSNLVLVGIFALLSILLLVLRDILFEAHINEAILKFASDASVYFEAYEILYADAELLESPALFLVGSPILFLKLADGNLILVQLFNLALMLFSLRTALNSLNTYHGRLIFIAASLIFPYFAFGFLSLNKEVYAMSAAIFFSSYMIRGKKSYLLFAFLLGACARYYMLIALVVLYFTVPRDRAPRFKLIALLLLGISVVAPIAKYVIPQYSAETVLEDAGTIGVLFSVLIDNYLYMLAYLFKYLMLLPTRAYGYFIGASEDAMGAAVSLLSIVIFVSACVVMFSGSQKPNGLIKRFFIAGISAPIPIMWTEIMHWRYFSFVYFFYLFAIVLYIEQKKESQQFSTNK